MHLPIPSKFLTLSLILLTLLQPTSAALRTPPSSFCKCICASNSTIIALNPTTTSSSNPSVRDASTPHHKLTCTDCTRAFCISYNLPACRGFAEDQFTATCFQRDNLKDELVIYGFLAATIGLLGWAGLKPLVEKARQRAGFGQETAVAENREGRYAPLNVGESVR